MAPLLAQTTQHRLLVTSLTGAGGKLSAIEWHEGAAQIVCEIPLTKAPHVVAVHPRQPIAYVACWGSPSEIVALRLHHDGSFSEIPESGTALISGEQPCSLAIDPRGRSLIIANYDGGITLVSLRSDGRFAADVLHTLHLTPPRVRAGRQDASHPHFVGFGPIAERVLATDLGTDHIYELELSKTARTIAVRTPITAPISAGPRHAAFLANHGMLVSNELSSSVSLYIREGDSYRLAKTVPSTARKTRPNYPSDVVVDAQGRFCFVGNRGADTLGVLRLDVDGITLIGEYDSGAWPLSITAIDDIVHCVSRDADALMSWRVDARGVLVELSRIAVPSPTWVTLDDQSRLDRS